MSPVSTAATRRIWLARHCDVENPGHVIYGHLPDFPLSTLGVEQAHSLGRRLAGRPIRRLVTSPLERARQTAEIIAGHLESPEIVVSDDLVEAEFGRHLQGVPVKQIPWRRPLWWVHMALPGLLPGDETVAHMAARLERPLHRLLDDLPDAEGLAISHGDPIQAFWLRHRRLPRWALHRLQCAKGGLLALDYNGHVLERVRYRPPQVDSRPEPEVAGAGTGHV
jgi:broad specificity phosphatase PhoE